MRGDLLGGLAVAPSSLPRRRRRHHHHSPPDDGDAQPLPPMLLVYTPSCTKFDTVSDAENTAVYRILLNLKFSIHRINTFKGHAKACKNLDPGIVSVNIRFKAPKIVHKPKFKEFWPYTIFAKFRKVPDSTQQAVIFSHGNFSFL